MGLFTQKPIELRQNLPYTVVTTTRNKLIVGLGNPGNQYNLTRHNLGFMAIDRFAIDNDYQSWQESKKFKGWVNENALGSNHVILLKPNTFMNLSGESVRALADFYSIDPEFIVAVYDELTIPFGQIRSRMGGQSAGHNGVKSLIEQLGTNFGRVRIGIKNNLSPQIEAAAFVLQKLDKNEQAVLESLLSEVSGLLTEFVFGNTLPNDTRKIDIN